MGFCLLLGEYISEIITVETPLRAERSVIIAKTKHNNQYQISHDRKQIQLMQMKQNQYQNH